jgi:hypothetical protein
MSEVIPVDERTAERMIAELVGLGYVIEIRTDGAFGSGQYAVAITPVSKGDWYPATSEVGYGDELEEALSFAIAGTSLSTRFGWQETQL